MILSSIAASLETITWPSADVESGKLYFLEKNFLKTLFLCLLPLSSVTWGAPAGGSWVSGGAGGGADGGWTRPLGVSAANRKQ